MRASFIYFTGSDFYAFTRNKALQFIICSIVHIHRVFFIHFLVDIFHEKQLGVIKNIICEFLRFSYIMQIGTQRTVIRLGKLKEKQDYIYPPLPVCEYRVLPKNLPSVSLVSTYCYKIHRRNHLQPPPTLQILSD